MKFSEKLKHIMTEMNLNQVNVVSLTGCSKGSVSMYLNDKCVPGKQKQKGIAVALGLPPDYFEKEESEPKDVVSMSDKTGIHRITVKELTKILGVDKDTASQIANNRDLPGLYACKASGNRNIYIINEAVFCRV